MSLPASSQERDARRSKSDVPSPDLARALTEAALEKKAIELVILDLRDLTNVTDFFVVGTVSTDVHSRAVESSITDRARDRFGSRPWHVEGTEGTRTWVLMDYVDVVVHLFQKEAREYYSLERLWGDAPAEEVRDPDDGGD